MTALPPEVVWEQAGRRVVITPEGPVFEEVRGRDALGVPVWRRLPVVDPELRAEGWKAICAAVGLQQGEWRRALRASRRYPDPLPVYYDPFDRPFSRVVELVAWHARNVLPAHARDAVRGRRPGTRRQPS